jgi:hypothetical protein
MDCVRPTVGGSIRSIQCTQYTDNDQGTHQAERVAVRGLGLDVRVDERLPLLDERVELLAGQVHAVEVGQDVRALHVLRHELELAVALLLVPALQLRQVHLEHAALQALGRDLCRDGGVCVWLCESDCWDWKSRGSTCRSINQQ